MTDRAHQIEDFLLTAGWDAAQRTAIAGDMSSRRYFRLEQNGQTAILMDADTSMLPFCTITDWLRNAGLSAPIIYDAVPEAGLLLLEDFGDTSMKLKLATEPARETQIFERCVALLLVLRKAAPPELPRPDAAELVDWTKLVDDHYVGFKQGGLDGFRTALSEALEVSLRQETSVSLRDFHSENIMWLPDRAGIRTLGLLDYQDAFLTHPAYDLVSLLTDARSWIPKELRSRVVEHYLAQSGDDRPSFMLAFDALSAQRNLRILGIFARARRHLDCLPNTYRYLMEALENPVFANVRDDVRRAVPPPAGLR